MRKFEDILNGLKGIFTGPFQWIMVVETLLLAVVIYIVFKTLWENNARRLIPVYILLIAATGVVTLFSVHFDATAFYLFVLLLSSFFLFLFSTEIKRSIWNAGKRPTMTASTAAQAKMTAVTARADEYVTGIVKAVQSLSKNNTGALIVLSNGNLPKEIVESGVALNAAISNQLIEGIFVPKAPLHDGAMIIYGDKIQAAGCFLPLTQRDFPKEYGTRHRAGIGVTEVADVSTIIVSEETGIVSVVKRGEITRYVDSENLRRFLKDYYWKEFNAEGKKA